MFVKENPDRKKKHFKIPYLFLTLCIQKIQNSTMIQLIFCIKYRKTSFGWEKRQKLNIALFAMAMKRGHKNVDL